MDSMGYKSNSGVIVQVMNATFYAYVENPSVELVDTAIVEALRINGRDKPSKDTLRGMVHRVFIDTVSIPCFSQQYEPCRASCIVQCRTRHTSGEHLQKILQRNRFEFACAAERVQGRCRAEGGEEASGSSPARSFSQSQRDRTIYMVIVVCSQDLPPVDQVHTMFPVSVAPHINSKQAYQSILSKHIFYVAGYHPSRACEPGANDTVLLLLLAGH
jgi:hypothetical protein